MQLYFIRHGQSENNLLWETTGSETGRSHDPELTDAGRRQAQQLAKFVGRPLTDFSEDERYHMNRSGFGFTHLYCSLMVRAVATGTYVANSTGLPLTAWSDWHEGGGIYLEQEDTTELRGLPGKARSYFEKHYPDLILPDGLDEKGWWNRPFEEKEERLPRARRVLTELIKRHGETNHRVAVISHGGFYNYFLTAILGLDNDLPAWFSLYNTAITRIDINDHRVNIVYTNRLDFLPGELIT